MGATSLDCLQRGAAVWLVGCVHVRQAGAGVWHMGPELYRWMGLLYPTATGGVLCVLTWHGWHAKDKAWAHSGGMGAGLVPTGSKPEGWVVWAS